MQTARHHSAGDIVRHKTAPQHIGRVAAVLGDRVRVRWGQTRWIGEADAGDVETIVTERTLFARLRAQHEPAQDDTDWYALSNGLSVVMSDGTLIHGTD